MERKLYRSRSDRMISGVCGGLADYLAVDPTLVRVGVVLLGIVTNGAVVIAYIIMSVAVPEEPAGGAATAPANFNGGVSVTDANESAPRDSEFPKAPDVVPAPETVSEPANAPSAMPAAPAWTPPSPEVHESRGGGGIGFGVVLIVVGGLLLANQFLPGIDLVRLWPVVIIAVGVSALIKGARR